MQTCESCKKDLPRSAYGAGSHRTCRACRERAARQQNRRRRCSVCDRWTTQPTTCGACERLIQRCRRPRWLSALPGAPRQYRAECLLRARWMGRGVLGVLPPLHPSLVPSDGEVIRHCWQGQREWSLAQTSRQAERAQILLADESWRELAG